MWERAKRMFDNLALIAALVIVLWIIATGVFLYYSRQQSDLEREIAALEADLDDEPGA